MEAGFEGSYAQQIDNTYVLEFLTTSASALNEMGILTKSDCDQFRADVLHLQKSKPGLLSHKPLLSRLIESKSTLLAILIWRYGEIGLSLNLARFTFREPFTLIGQSFAEMIEDLLAKAKLTFNRSIYISLGGSFQHRVLLSSLIMDVCESLDQSLKAVQDILITLNSFEPSDVNPTMPLDAELDQLMAKKLGFQQVLVRSGPFRLEKAINQRLADALVSMAGSVALFSRHCMSSGYNIVGPQVAPTCEWLEAEGWRLLHVSFPDNFDLPSWELRRQNYLHAILRVHQQICLLKEGLTDLLSVSQLSRHQKPPLLEAHKRAIVCGLLSRGNPLPKCQEVIVALHAYLKDRQAAFEDLLGEEGAVIHPLLSSEFLNDILKPLRANEAKEGESSEKKQLLIRAQGLTDSLMKMKSWLSAVTLLLLFILPIGCGHKLPPQSKVKDERPEIPFKESAKAYLNQESDFEILKKRQKKSKEKGVNKEINSSPETNKGL